MAGNDSQPVWLLLDKKNPLIYRKEVIYQGDFGKLDQHGDGIEFSAYRRTLEHWRDSFGLLTENGVKVPFSRSHETWSDSESKLGEVIEAAVEKNKKGLDALFLSIRFENEESRDIALKGDVSIGSPPVWFDGKKNRYTYPLQHVASTTAPVIPGLESWQAIAAAFGDNKSKGSAMELDELITLLGIEVDESVNTDEAKKALVMAKLKELVGSPTPPADAVDGEGASVEAGQVVTPAPVAAPVQTQAKKVTVAFSHSPLEIKTIRKGRTAEVEGLVAQKKISPAVAQKLKLSHCTDDGIKLELSSGGDGKAFDDAVELAILASKNTPLAESGRAPATDDASVIELSHNQSANSFVESCEKAAKAS